MHICTLKKAFYSLMFLYIQYLNATEANKTDFYF